MWTAPKSSTIVALGEERGNIGQIMIGLKVRKLALGLTDVHLLRHGGDDDLPVGQGIGELELDARLAAVIGADVGFPECRVGEIAAEIDVRLIGVGAEHLDPRRPAGRCETNDCPAAEYMLLPLANELKASPRARYSGYCS